VHFLNFVELSQLKLVAFMSESFELDEQ